MKILETVLFALTFVLFVIGVHQTLVYGFINSYFIFTFAVFTFLGYGYLKNARVAGSKNDKLPTTDKSRQMKAKGKSK